MALDPDDWRPQLLHQYSAHLFAFDTVDHSGNGQILRLGSMSDVELMDR